MAGYPPADGSGDGSVRRGKKRGVGGDSEEQEKPKRRSWNPFASTEEKFDPEVDQGAATPSPPPMTAEERAEHQIRMAKAVDEASRVAETERILDVVAREAYNPDIKPTDAEWIKKREEIVALLQDKKKSVLKLLKELGIEDRSFKALQLLPPKTEDLALELQRENTELYKKAMGPGGPFEHIHDNLATKLTMLHFELPIEPLTLKNVTNCEMDIDDPPDDEEEAPRVQRIIYSEKALQFLDCYHERSFGFPMLRRPKVIVPNIPQPVDENSQPPGQNSVRHGPSHQHRARQPVQPTGDLLRIRGGGGTSSNRYLYSRYGASIKLEAIDNEVPADEFRRAALKALDLHPDSAWAIVVDQFDNSEDLKETIVKPFATSFVVRSSDFNKIYESHLKARISNQLENCILSVDYYHLRTNGEINTDPFIIPLRSRSGRDTLDLTKLPKVRPKNNKDATHLPTLPQVSTPSLKRAIRELHAYPGGAPQAFEDNAGSFTRAIKKLFPSEAATAVSVSLYSRQHEKTTKEAGAPLDHTILFPLTTNLRQYLDIHKRVFQGSGWTVVVHQTTTAPAAFWPPSSGGPSSAQIKNPRFLVPKPRLATAPIYWGSRGVQTIPTSSDFGKQALKLLGLDPRSHWEFAVDFYSNQLNRVDGASHALDFSHTVRIRKASLEEQYLEDIQPLLFRGEEDWAAVVRLSSDDAAPSFTPFEVLPNPPIPAPPAPPPAHIPHGNRPPPSRAKLANPKSSTPPTSPVISTGPSFIYGYSGRIEAEKNVTSFKESALALLGLSNVDGWTFTVDLHDTNPPRSINVSAATIANRFERFIKNVPGDPNTYPWPVFVRKCAKVSAKRLAPPDDLRHYVILRRPGRESYWKLPTPLDDRYGMNQLQDAFFAAMLVHYPLGSLRPPQSVNFNTDLGYGGMEITQDFWDTITGYFSRYSDQAFTVCGNIPPASTDLSKGMGIRLAGTHRYGTFQPRDFTGLAKALRELSQAVIFDKAQNYTSPPTTFRAWYTAENRENNVDSHIFYYDDNDPNAPRSMALEDSLKAWFQSESIRKSTNCIWFRPEWKQFTIIDDSTSDLGDMDVDHTNETWDATVDSSLDSFRDMLVMLYGDGDDDYPENFEIIIPRTNQRFVINRQTTEDSWRKHVFDYFHHNTLIVKRSDGIPCIIDSTEPWGILDIPSSVKPGGMAPHIPLSDQPKPLAPSHDYLYGHYHHHDLHMNNNSGNENDNGYGNSKYTSDEPPPVVQPPHEPRGIPGAKPPVFGTTEVPKFDEWMLNHTAQNTLQQRSWTQDQSVIEPGYAPAAPLYGDNLELAITAGPSMPTVFTQHLTPTDIMQLRKENRKLLNHALEREIGCPICNMTFKAYDNDSKAAHFKDHIDQLNSVGTCPMCNETWALFTFEQKRNHLLADFAKKESQDILQFWEDTRCPICNLELRSKSAEDVTTHIASHVPGALKFCDRCGFDVLACAPAEKAHHDRVCTRNTSVREPGMPDPIICQNCGKERTPASENIREHDLCGNGQFCIRCRLDLSFLDAQEQHEHFKRCRVPGGAAGTNCKRCGKKLAGLSARGLASHNNECYRREPVSLAADDNPAYKLSEAVESQRLKNAIDLADVRARQSELRAQENAMLAREQAVLEREQEGDELDRCFPNFADLAGDATCYLCQINLKSHSRQDIVDHFRRIHGKDTSGLTAAAPRDLDALSRGSLQDHLYQHANETFDDAHSVDSYDMMNCPIQGCRFRLGNHSRMVVRDHFATHAGLVPPTGCSEATNVGHCPVNGCPQVLGNMTRQQMVKHFATHTAGNSATAPVTFQCPFPLPSKHRCPERLSLANDADDLLAHYHHHGEKVTGHPVCHSDALNAPLAEFKRRLPAFREAHAILQNLVDASGNAGTQDQTTRPHQPKTPAEREWEEKEHKLIYQMDNQLGIKRAKEEYNLKHATEAIRKQRSDLVQLRAALADAEDANPVVEGASVPDPVAAARKKVDEAEAALSKAEKDEERRSAIVAVHIGQQAAALAVRKKACNYVPDPAHVKYDNGQIPGGTLGGIRGAGGPGGADSGGLGGGGGGDDIPGDDDDANQAGFLPSPAPPSLKKLPTPRRARSVKERAPPTGFKRKKSAMEDSEDTMSGGGFSNLVRSPSKRETKKMRMASERAGSPEMTRRPVMIAEEVEGGGEFDGREASKSGMTRRTTRGMAATTGAAPRKVGRTRKVVQEDIQVDGFEDVEEEGGG